MANQKIKTNVISVASADIITTNSTAISNGDSAGQKSIAGICVTSETFTTNATVYMIDIKYDASIPYNGSLSAGGSVIPRTWNIESAASTLLTTIAATATATLESLTPTVSDITFADPTLTAEFNFAVEYEIDMGEQTITVLTDET